MNAPILAIVVPCYNEEEVILETASRLQVLISNLIEKNLIDSKSYVLFVDDGSRDKTWDIVGQLFNRNQCYKGLKLSRNFGHQNALLAGLYHVEDADLIISIDADLQDDINAIEQMVLKNREGYDVVYGVRDDRTSDTWFKRNTALRFYNILSALGVESVYNHADYRLMSRRALDAFLELREVNLYLRGMVPLVGFKQASVYYKRGERFAGESKYNFTKMLSFAWNGLSSMSVKPLHFVTVCGFGVFFLSILLTIYSLVIYFMMDTTPGWASTVIPIYFLGGIQLLCIGLIGEYIAKVYKEVKQRPRFIIEEHLK